MSESERENPLDVVEEIANDNDWLFERGPGEETPDESIVIPGTGASAKYTIAFTWLSDLEVLQLSCLFRMKVPEKRHPQAQALLAGVNEHLWVGHLEIGPHDTIIFRYSFILAGGVQVTAHQCEVALARAVDTCERYSPSLQFVLRGKSPKEAMETAMIETKGSA